MNELLAGLLTLVGSFTTVMFLSAMIVIFKDPDTMNPRAGAQASLSFWATVVSLYAAWILVR